MPGKKSVESAKHRQTTTNDEGFFEPFNIDAVPWNRLPGSTAFKRLGRFGGGSQVGVGLDILKPGQTSNRFHYHLREEEHVFILKGSATLVLGSRTYVMGERDYCCFPAGQQAGHHLRNHTRENCVFMTIGDNHPDDIACFPNTGKARIRATGKTVPLGDVLESVRGRTRTLS
ncbi:MAG TPA: cupin domain-containing protein [Steroidobacteraceae bacterium]|nr:cupin domain-containing protein [Steroidobacteraceae bacterium]